MPDRQSSLAAWVQPLLGGPDGTHLQRTARDARVRAQIVLGLLGAMAALGVLIQAPCMNVGWAAETALSHVCGSPLIEQYLDASRVTGLGGTSWAAMLGWVASLSGSPAWSAVSYASLVAMLNLIGFAMAGIAMLRLSPLPWWVLAFALSPLVPFTVLQSFDPLGVALALWGLICLVEKRSAVVAGILFALAAAINPLALVVALGLLLALWARNGHGASAAEPSGMPGQSSAFAPQALLFVGTLLVGAAFLFLLDPRSSTWLGEWFSVRAEDGSALGILAQLGIAVPDSAAAVVTVFGVLAAVLGIAVLLRSAMMRGVDIPLFAPIAAVVAVTLLLVPSVPQTFSLWLLPFAVLAVPHWGLHLPWMGVELFWAIGSSLYALGVRTDAAGLPPNVFGPLCVLRLTAFAVIGALALLSVRPSRPRIARAGADPGPRPGARGRGDGGPHGERRPESGHPVANVGTKPV